MNKYYKELEQLCNEIELERLREELEQWLRSK